MNSIKKISFLITLAAFLSLASCDEKIPSQQRPPAAMDDHGHDHDGGHGHDHDAHAAQHAAGGPHGGHIIELSHDHTFHAELTDDHSTDTVTVYLLDKDLKQIETEQNSVTLILMADEKTESFELSGDGSTFSASSSAMLELLEADGATGKVRVNIEGKAMSGTFSHHDSDHGHDH